MRLFSVFCLLLLCVTSTWGYSSQVSGPNLIVRKTIESKVPRVFGVDHSFDVLIDVINIGDAYVML